jgi:hypothetical protein
VFAIMDEQKAQQQPPSNDQANGATPPTPEMIDPALLEGFKLSEEQQEIVDELDAELEALDQRRTSYVDSANRQIAAFDGAKEVTKSSREKFVSKAQKKWADRRKAELEKETQAAAEASVAPAPEAVTTPPTVEAPTAEAAL